LINKSTPTAGTFGSLGVTGGANLGSLEVDGQIQVESGGILVESGDVVIATGDLILSGATSTINAAGK
jgi:hypothetical protein